MTSPLLYPWEDPPTLGQEIAIAPGLGWVRMPLPFALDHVNLWLLRDETGLTLIDTGFGNELTRGVWRTLLADEKLVRVLVTHYHPDHIGNAGWFESLFGVPIMSSERGFLWAQTMCYLPEKIELERRLDFYRSHGMEEAQITEMAKRRNWYPQGVPRVPGCFQRLSEGQILSLGGMEWQVIITHGHASEHVCLFSKEKGILIAGDQILPRISPNVGVWFTEPEGDPLDLFLHSLRRLYELPKECLVLPSHGLPFYGLHERTDALLQHHEDRLNEVVAACRTEALTAAEVARILFRRPLDLHQMAFAMAEAVAHLNRLVVEGRVIVEKQAHSIRFRCR